MSRIRFQKKVYKGLNFVMKSFLKPLASRHCWNLNHTPFCWRISLIQEDRLIRGVKSLHLKNELCEYKVKAHSFQYYSCLKIIWCRFFLLLIVFSLLFEQNYGIF